MTMIRARPRAEQKIIDMNSEFKTFTLLIRPLRPSLQIESIFEHDHQLNRSTRKIIKTYSIDPSVKLNRCSSSNDDDPSSTTS
uniref:Uncharacterized protein n=1 Tax=Pristionchus pacificus TaxID=54126 RepID=A0A2A6B2X7_PRIPA|eukprot:PDM60236.1 hypothetical protein PRIPAC_54061 [Pristionchus pacificus]